MSNNDLYKVYETFCSFGASRNSLGSNGSLTDISGPSMDGAKFAKFCRDNNVQHGKVTSTEVDIVFNKVKAKNARKIGFEEFKEALKILAAKRYEQKTGDDAYKFLVHQIVTNDNRPIAKATTVKNDAVLSRLTDVKAYTGTHKNRFDENGHGLGKAGRDPATISLSNLANREPANIRGVNLSFTNAKDKSRSKGSVNAK